MGPPIEPVPMSALSLVRPTLEHLPSYVHALKRGWSFHPYLTNASERELATIESDPRAFLQSFEDPDALAGPVEMPDGSFVARIPSIGRWMWDGEFCGIISLRWQKGTTDLPPTCLGHIGYSVIPWKRRLGYATAALAQILPEARERGLPFVEVVTDLDNVVSQRVILKNGGVLIEQFEKAPATGGGQALRFRIDLT